jgi:SAM-dependent methyltransferase
MDDAARYGQIWASIYDDVHAHLDPTLAVTALHELAAGGAALELGVGTGRVAIPLAAAGTRVHGLDASEAMLAKLRAKPGGAAVTTTLGDFTQIPVEGQFALVYIVFSTISGLLAQDAQVACFRAAAGKLATNGVFVVETFVPDPTRFDRQQRVQVNRIEDGRVDLIVSKHDPVAQHVRSQHIQLGGDGLSMHPVEVRYVWPSELDLMAQLAGLRLRARWGSWKREPFAAGSPMAISIYER